jgi:Beta propeller domain
VSGFSEYLHPIDREDKLLLSIGHEADENGLILGYQVSLFDASVVAEPRLVDRLVVENRANSWSSSSASWDERAFRFLPLGDEMGKLIIPLSIYTENPQSQNFEGFTVFNIENGTITKDFDIDHSLEVKNDILCNRWFEWLPERSFVFDGNVVTMKKHTIISTSLSSGETLWNIPIDGSLHDCQVP